MINVVRKWKIVVKSADTGTKNFTFFINDDHMSNVLTKLSYISFDFNVMGVDITLEPQ